MQYLYKILCRFIFIFIFLSPLFSSAISWGQKMPVHLNSEDLARIALFYQEQRPATQRTFAGLKYGLLQGTERRFTLDAQEIYILSHVMQRLGEEYGMIPTYHPSFLQPIVAASDKIVHQRQLELQENKQLRMEIQAAGNDPDLLGILEKNPAESAILERGLEEKHLQQILPKLMPYLLAPAPQEQLISLKHALNMLEKIIKIIGDKSKYYLAYPTYAPDVSDLGLKNLDFVDKIFCMASQGKVRVSDSVKGSFELMEERALTLKHTLTLIDHKKSLSASESESGSESDDSSKSARERASESESETSSASTSTPQSPISTTHTIISGLNPQAIEVFLIAKAMGEPAAESEETFRHALMDILSKLESSPKTEKDTL